MYCTNCGKQVPDTAAFCPECGTRKMILPAPAPVRAAETAPAAAPTAEAASAPKTQTVVGKTGRVIRLIIGILGIAMGAVYMSEHLPLVGGTLKTVIRSLFGVIQSSDKTFGGLLLASGIVSVSRRRGKVSGIVAAALFFTASLVGFSIGSGLDTEMIFAVMAGIFGASVLIASLAGNEEEPLP